jgi:hypothetical protein
MGMEKDLTRYCRVGRSRNGTRSTVYVWDWHRTRSMGTGLGQDQEYGYGTGTGPGVWVRDWDRTRSMGTGLGILSYISNNLGSCGGKTFFAKSNMVSL